MDKVEEKLTDLEGNFDTAWKDEVSILEQLKLDLLNFVIVGAFYFLSWFFLFAIFFIPSSLGAILLNIKFLLRSFRQPSVPAILIRLVITVIAVPMYCWGLYSVISSYLF